MSTLRLLDAAGRRRSRATWTTGASTNLGRGSRVESRCRSKPCSLSSMARLADGPGRTPRRATTCAASQRRPACDAASPPQAAPCPRRGDGPRRCFAEGDPTPARPRQPRRDIGLSRQHRDSRDHRHRPQPTTTHDLRHRRADDPNSKRSRAHGERHSHRCSRSSHYRAVATCSAAPASIGSASSRAGAELAWSHRARSVRERTPSSR
jgi:hypothetical protein